MIFDFTKGKKMRYIVTIYRWNVTDSLYYHYYDEAKSKFDSINEKDVFVSLYDDKTDKRKLFKKL